MSRNDLIRAWRTFRYLRFPRLRHALAQFKLWRQYQWREFWLWLAGDSRCNWEKAVDRTRHFGYYAFLPARCDNPNHHHHVAGQSFAG